MLSNYAVYNEQIQTSAMEILSQNVEVFNESSRGAIMLTGDFIKGDFIQEAYWKNIDSALRDVDAYAALAAAPVTDLEQGEIVGVKKDAGFGPVRLSEHEVKRLGESPEDVIENIASGFANAVLKYQLNTGIAAAVGAFAQNADSFNDLSATAGISQSGLNSSHAKFGDASQRIVADVITGTAFHELVAKGLANGERLFEAGNVTIQSILGKVLVVTDSPALFEAGIPNKTKSLSLTSGGIMIEDAADFTFNLDRSNGQTKIVTTWQADLSFVVKLKGYEWDKVTGGKSPTDAEIATGTNWIRSYDDVKNTAGVLGVYDADQ